MYHAYLVGLQWRNDPDSMDLGSLRNIVEMVEKMGINSMDAYLDDLEKPLVEATRYAAKYCMPIIAHKFVIRQFYLEKHQMWFNEMTLSEYMERVQSHFDRETHAIGAIFHDSTMQKILSVRGCLGIAPF